MHGFYPLSEFCIFKSLRTKPKPLVFPKYMMMSRNHYNRTWSLKAFRRLKNVIVTMDWVVDSTQVGTDAAHLDKGFLGLGFNKKMTEDPSHRQLNDEQEKQLRKTFNLFDAKQVNNIFMYKHG